MREFWRIIVMVLCVVLLSSTCAMLWSVPNPPKSGEFNVHFLGVTAGDAIVIDMDDREIVIDGGLHPTALSRFTDETDIIQKPIELVILTHSDIDHWYGLRRLLIEEGVEFLEFWEPGYDPGDDGDSEYNEFINGIKRKLAEDKFARPLGDVEGKDLPNTIARPTLPGVKFTLLHSSAHPKGHNSAYRRNNASIVFMVEISGVKMLFTGDATGKCKPGNRACEEYADRLGKRIGGATDKKPKEKTVEGYVIECGDPLYVEEKLLAMNAAYPGILEADILKVPHHGSETSSTPQFIQAVNPTYAVITATGPFLPKRKVIMRYRACSEAEILCTGEGSLWNTNHISCTGGDGEFVCGYMENF
jgi:beta-lactamase superfamily II metal-dependent hydrolase